MFSGRSVSVVNDTQKTKKELIARIRELERRISELEVLSDQRQDIHKAFEESEKRYRSVFENTGTATVIIEADMTLSVVNAKFVELTGYFRDEIEGKMKWTQFVVAEDLKRMKEYHQKRRKDRSLAPTEYECRVFNRFNEVKDMFVRIDMIPGTSQSVASFMDITAFKKTEAALIESERRLSKLMSNLPGMAYRFEPDRIRTMKFVSAGCKGLTGYTSHELTGEAQKGFIALIHPDDREKVLAGIQEALAQGRSFQLEYRIVTASGQVQWVWEEGLGMVSESGAVDAVEGFISDITAHKLEEQQLRRENIHLRTSIQERYRFGDLIGKNRQMQEVYARISKAAASDANVIIYGESGTGKELVAREIHRLSESRDRSFVPVNCSAIPENLFESEFFGYEKGAFTGAEKDKPGYFAAADGGTLFLDELGEIGPAAQVKLLRVLEGGGYTPVGGHEVKKVKVRIVAATNRDLKQDVQSGRMREDFFYRIHVIPITLPPLRERKDDLPLLIEHFLSVYAGSEKKPQIDGRVLGQLYNYDWPGNVRELQNVLQRDITLKTLDFMSPAVSELSQPVPEEQATDKETSFDTMMGSMEKKVILEALEKNKWHRGKTAAMLKVNRKTLFRKLKKYGLI